MHVDFYQVDPTRPIQASVPVRFVGESPAVRDLGCTLLPSLDVVAVRCLPLAIPDGIEVSLTKLKSFDVSLVVGDSVAPDGVEILTDPSVVMATVNPPRIRLTGCRINPGVSRNGARPHSTPRRHDRSWLPPLSRMVRCALRPQRLSRDYRARNGIADTDHRWAPMAAPYERRRHARYGSRPAIRSSARGCRATTRRRWAAARGSAAWRSTAHERTGPE